MRCGEEKKLTPAEIKLGNKLAQKFKPLKAPPRMKRAC